MATTRSAQAEWLGNLREGKGQLKLGSGAFAGAYSFSSRFAEGQGTNPEEMLGAAHAGCFSMALAAALTRAGYAPRRIQTSAKVRLDQVGEGFEITGIELTTQAEVPGIDAAAFKREAEAAKETCPLSKALKSVPIKLNAELGKL